MLRKEFNDQLKQALFLVIFVIALTLFSGLLSLIFEWDLAYKEVFIAAYQVGLLVFAMVSGLSLFSSEKNQGGVEYVLTLPMSRYKLLFTKISPRLATLAGLFVVYILLSMITGTQGLADILPGLPTTVLLYGVCSLFIISLTLSVSHQNFVLLAIVAIFTAMVHFFFLYGAFWLLIEKVFHRYVFNAWPWSITMGIIGIILPLVISFFIAFKRFDIRAPQGFNRKFRKVFVPLLLIGLIVSFAMFYMASNTWYDRYYVTEDNRIIKFSEASALIYDGKDSRKVDIDFKSYWTIFEKEGFLYMMSYYGENKGIYKIDTHTFQLEPIYKNERMPSYSSLKKYKNSLTFTIRGGGYDPERDIYFLDLDSKETKKLELDELLPAGYFNPQIFGAGELEGKRFWLFRSAKLHRFPLVRLWEDGKTDILGQSLSAPGFYNNLLITNTKEGLELSRLDLEGKQLLKVIPQGKKVNLLNYWGRILDTEQIKKIYVTERVNLRKSKIFSLDLETLELKNLGEWTGFVYYQYPGQYFLIKQGKSLSGKRSYVTKIATIQDDKIQTIQEFSVEDKVIFHFASGRNQVFEQDGKLWFYTYPDLKQITFSK